MNEPTRPDTGEAEPAGRRAHSRITLVVNVYHDGDPWILGRHLMVELDALIEAWGNVVADMAEVASVEVLSPGDDVSAKLPAIGAAPAAPEPPQSGDPRFTVGLAIDVARVLEQHGYEPLNGGQIVELQQHLFHLLHGNPGGDCHGGAR